MDRFAKLSEAITSYISRTFNSAIVFDAPFKSVYSQTADITFSLGTSPVADVNGRITITGDGIHACNFPIGWTNASGQLFDNQQKNVIYFEYDGVEVIYAIVVVIIPDVIPPYITSAVINNAAKNQVILTYSELLDTGSVPATGDFSANLSKAISAVSVLGSQVTLNMSTNYAFGDAPTLSYTPGGNPIRDLAHNNAVSLTTYAVTNNVLAARQSAYITNNAQKLQTAVQPSALAWGSGGNDVPVSRSFWIKRNNTATNYLFDINGIANDGPEEGFILHNDGTVQWFFVNGGAVVTNIGAITANVWTHVCLTYDGSGLQSGMKVYYNGSLQASTASGSGYTKLTGLVTDSRLTIFGRPLTGDTENIYSTQLCSFYGWNIELTSGNVSTLYNGGVFPVDPTAVSFASNLVFNVEFNGNTNDTSASGYNLSSSSAPTYVIDTP